MDRESFKLSQTDQLIIIIITGNLAKMSNYFGHKKIIEETYFAL